MLLSDLRFRTIMHDSFGRHISYLRVSVTDRCNLRCAYCKPTSGDQTADPDDLLSLSEIEELLADAVGLGFSKVRFTGGEPLLREELPRIVCAAVRAGFSDVALTTNGQLLGELAGKLARAGLMRVNVSLDSMDPDTYHQLTRGGQLSQVLSGLKAAEAAGLTPIKLNCVVPVTGPGAEAAEVAAFAATKGYGVRFIRQMDLAAGVFSPIEGGSAGECALCNRIRVTATGMVRPCLFSDLAFSIRELGPIEAFKAAVAAKPERGVKCSESWLYKIGG